MQFLIRKRYIRAVGLFAPIDISSTTKSINQSINQFLGWPK